MTTYATDSEMRPWAAGWRPGEGYQMTESSGEMPRFPEIPDSHLEYSVTPSYPDETTIIYPGALTRPKAPKVGRGMFTYLPEGQDFNGVTLGPWGSQYGKKNERDAWVNRDLLGQFVLIRVLRFGVDGGTSCFSDGAVIQRRGQKVFDFTNNPFEDPLVLDFYPQERKKTRGDESRYEWVFGYINSYNSYSGLHELVFRFGDIHFNEYWVDLDRCVFQNWTRPDVTRYMTKKRAIDIQRVWRGYYSRTYWDLPALG